MIEARALYETAERLLSIVDNAPNANEYVSGTTPREVLLEMIPYEVLLRIIVGRAYFSLFLDARIKAWAEDAGSKRVGVSRRTHRDVREYYERKKGDAGRRISHNLLMLANNRNAADYDINEDVSIDMARQSLSLCRKALDDISRLN